MFATVVCQALEEVHAPTFGMLASDEILATDLPGFALGELDRLGFEKKRLQIGNGVHCHVDSRIVARLRGKCLAVEKHPLQYRIGKDDVFGE